MGSLSLSGQRATHTTQFKHEGIHNVIGCFTFGFGQHWIICQNLWTWSKLLIQTRSHTCLQTSTCTCLQTRTCTCLPPKTRTCVPPKTCSLPPSTCPPCSNPPCSPPWTWLWVCSS